jgi:hypothetical protein
MCAQPIDKTAAVKKTCSHEFIYRDITTVEGLAPNKYRTRRKTNSEKEKAMTRNEGTIDRATRIIVGALLIIGAATGTIGLWGYIGILPLITGAVGVCPAYSLLGINTCPMNRRV